jgi:hypothetical protein
MYTIGTAAKATGKSKSTISRDVDKGKISAVKNEDGSYSIDPAELHRVYPPAGSSNGLSEDQSNDRQPGDASPRTGWVERELQHSRERLSLLEGERDREREQLLEQIDDLRRRLDRTEEERRDKDRQLTALLTDQRQRRYLRWWWRRKGEGAPFVISMPNPVCLRRSPQEGHSKRRPYRKRLKGRLSRRCP